MPNGSGFSSQAVQTRTVGWSDAAEARAAFAALADGMVPRWRTARSPPN
jgi:hypothetical protein